MQSFRVGGVLRCQLAAILHTEYSSATYGKCQAKSDVNSKPTQLQLQYCLCSVCFNQTFNMDTAVVKHVEARLHWQHTNNITLLKSMDATSRCVMTVRLLSWRDLLLYSVALLSAVAYRYLCVFVYRIYDILRGCYRRSAHHTGRIRANISHNTTPGGSSAGRAVHIIPAGQCCRTCRFATGPHLHRRPGRAGLVCCVVYMAPGYEYKQYITAVPSRYCCTQKGGCGGC